MVLRRVGTTIVVLSVLAVSLFLVSGCTTTLLQKTDGPAAVDPPVDKGPAPRYYDFGDILVPSELKLQADESYIVETQGPSAGTLTLKGRSPVGLLFAFFRANMPKDNWKLLMSFKSPQTVMLYQKANRWCVINITESYVSTKVVISVAPTEGGLLK